MKVIKVESVAAVLALHWFVARDEGLFAAEGLNVEIVTPPPPAPFAPGDPRLVDPRLVDSFNYQNYFEQNACDVFRGCEWGQIRRADDSKRGDEKDQPPAAPGEVLDSYQDSAMNHEEGRRL